MPGPSKVIVLDPDMRASRQVQLGFEREGVPTRVISAGSAGAATLDLPGDLPGDDVGLVVVGGENGQGLEFVRRTRALLGDRRIDVPILFAGRGVERKTAEAAGADEVMQEPAYLRDVVTIGRLLRGQPASQRGRLMGNLADVTGVLTLVRALAAMGRSATLTLVRGLRRGEIRFFHGEVTSAQIGVSHGQAALHQLLLWTDARFDFHHEDIIRRQQIPLTHEELFADAGRFLESVRDSSGGLSPSMVIEQDVERTQLFGRQIPTEVYGVLRMFDGYRMLSDVLEDSAYRVFETLRVTQRAVDVGLLRVVDKQPSRATWHTILSIEEWLIGTEIRARPVDPEPVRTPQGGSPARATEPAATRNRRGKNSRKPRRRKKRRLNTSPATPIRSAAPPQIDWGALIPRIIGAEVGPLSGVVPAAHVSGEIVASPPTVEPDQPDEQPSIVFDEAAGDSDAHARTGSADPENAAVRAIPDAHAAPDPDAPAEAGGGAGDADGHVQALRVLAATVSISHDPARIARDLLVGDTKPERLLGRSRPAEDTGNPGEELEITIIHDSSPAASGATTARIAVPVLPDAAASDAAASDAAPAAITDEPSDGVIRHPIATAETAPVRRRRMLTEPPEDDRPLDAVGEITAPRARVTAEPRMSEPSILVPDLAVIHAEVSASVSEQVTAPVLANAASSALEAPVAPVPSGADSLRDVEETFFGADHDKDATGGPAPSRPESFDDLDQGYRPVGFWDRLRGKGTRRPDTPVPPEPPDPHKPGDKQS